MLNTEKNISTLPVNWTLTTLENICEILDSKRLPVNVKDREKRIAGKSKDQLFPYYGATGQVGWIDDYIFDGEYVLLGEDGAPFLDVFNDKAYIVNGRFWVNNHAHILKAYISNKLLCYYLNQLDYKYFVTGTTRLKLNQASMKQIPVAIPPIAEQNQIAKKIEEFFSELDKGIESLKKAREQLKTYRQAVLKHAFEGKLTQEWRARQAVAGNPPEPADKLLDRIREEREAHYKQQVEEWEKACERAAAEGSKKPVKPKKPKALPPPSNKDTSALQDIPVGWVWTNLSKIKFFSIYGPRFSSKDYSEEGIAVLRTTDISEFGKVDWINAPKLPLRAEEYEKYKLIQKDLLITRTGSIGRLSVFNDNVAAIPGAFLIHYRLSHLINIWYVFYYLKSHEA